MSLSMHGMAVEAFVTAHGLLRNRGVAIDQQDHERQLGAFIRPAAAARS